jgi:hypothetical protein
MLSIPIYSLLQIFHISSGPHPAICSLCAWNKAAREGSCLPHTSSAQGQNERSRTSSSPYAIVTCVGESLNLLHFLKFKWK